MVTAYLMRRSSDHACLLRVLISCELFLYAEAYASHPRVKDDTVFLSMLSSDVGSITSRVAVIEQEALRTAPARF